MHNGNFFKVFRKVTDIRQEGRVLHQVIEVLFIVVVAIICGCNNVKEIHTWATVESNEKWLRKHLVLMHGIPSQSTISRVITAIEPNELEDLFIEWIHTIINIPEGDIISIDGKTSRGSHDKINGNKAIHIVSALCNSSGIFIGQVKTDEKSNEITAIPQLLDQLFIEGCIVTIDAMGTQKAIAKKIVEENNADYVLNLKGNQETLHDEVEDYFDDLEEEGVLDEIKSGGLGIIDYREQIGIVVTKEKDHGRIETRTYFYSTDIDWMIDAKRDWTNLNGIGMVERKVEINNEVSIDRSFYIGSIDNVQDFSKSVRCHWGIESGHWSLDVTFRDDDNRTRKGNAPQNIGLLKRMAFNILQKEKDINPKLSKNCKRIVANCDHGYREKLLA